MKKKLLIFKNGQYGILAWRFFLSVFKNTKQINNCVFIVFKAELKLKHEENFFWTVFLQKPKTHFFGGKNKIVLKLIFQICISAFVFIVKGSFIPIFERGPLDQ